MHDQALDTASSITVPSKGAQHYSSAARGAIWRQSTSANGRSLPDPHERVLVLEVTTR